MPLCHLFLLWRICPGLLSFLCLQEDLNESEQNGKLFQEGCACRVPCFMLKRGKIVVAAAPYLLHLVSNLCPQLTGRMKEREREVLFCFADNCSSPAQSRINQKQDHYPHTRDIQQWRWNLRREMLLIVIVKAENADAWVILCDGSYYVWYEDLVLHV